MQTILRSFELCFYLKHVIMLTCLTVANYYAQSMTQHKMSCDRNGNILSTLFHV